MLRPYDVLLVLVPYFNGRTDFFLNYFFYFLHNDLTERMVY